MDVSAIVMIGSVFGLLGPQGLILLVVVFLLFGGGKSLPNLARALKNLGKSFHAGRSEGPGKRDSQRQGGDQ